MNQRFLNHIKQKNLFNKEEKLLLALSGGVDSMVLFYLLQQNGFTFSVAHVNHSTREGESDKDALFVQGICNKYNIPFHLNTLDSKTEQKNFQAYARKERYAFFRSLNPDKILIAHHSDDNLETVLLHYFTGRSTRGIPEVNQSVIRPLLIFDKDEIRTFARDNNIEFVEDSTNSKDTYDRNFIRNKIIPVLESHFPHLKKRILGLSAFIADNDELLNQCASELIELDALNDKLIINKTHLGEGKSLLLYHAIKSFGFNQSQAEDMINNIDHIGIQFFSDTYHLIVDRENIIIGELRAQDEKRNVRLDALPTVIEFNNYQFTFSLPQGQKGDPDRHNIYCDIDKVGKEVIIRNWQDGDYFYPSGMQGHSQSLKKYFANNKVDRLLKSEVPLVCSADDDIIWIASMRQDERFLPDQKTKQLIQISVSYKP